MEVSGKYVRAAPGGSDEEEPSSYSPYSSETESKDFSSGDEGSREAEEVPAHGGIGCNDRRKRTRTYAHDPD